MTLEIPALQDGRQEAVTGEVLQVLWSSPDGHFSVVRFAPEDTHEPIVAVGDLGAVTPGEPLRLLGRWGEHPRHGRRFEVESFAPVVPTSRMGIVRFLGSGRIPGIGPALAQRIVARFGERTLDVITSQSGRLREVSGIGPARARTIAAAVRARREEAETLSFLHALGLGPATARKVLRRYGEQAVQALREDPYRIAEEVPGLGFQVADRIARHLGIGEHDPRRQAGAVMHLIRRDAEAGHVHATVASLREGLERLEIPQDGLDSVLHTLRGRKLVILEGEAVYERRLHAAEIALAAHLATHAAAPPLGSARQASRPVRGTARKDPSAREAISLVAVPGDPSPPTTARTCEGTSTFPRLGTSRTRHSTDPARSGTGSHALSEEQRLAVEQSVTRRLLVLTGGPGTGKTTTVRSIVSAHLAMERRVLLCAPTGRAAKRLSEATGHPASTIHRALEWNPQLGSFQRGRDHPLEADLVLVDEASMMDLPLAAALAEAIPTEASWILVGDVDQLPPVGPGQVLRDVIDSGLVPTTRLHRVFRQAQRSAIVRGAHAILRGEAPEPSPSGHVGEGDLHIVEASDPEQIARLLPAVLERIRAAYGLDPRRDVQILSPMRRGPLGTERLNELLQHHLNPRHRSEGGRPGPGDRIMQLRNDYEREVFNGDVGEVLQAMEGKLLVRFDDRRVEYEGEALEAIALAYASTVHKVQGGEFPAVVLVLHGSHHVLLDRSLLYTAVTRAKRLVVLLGERRALHRAVRHAARRQLRSRLTARLEARIRKGGFV